MTDDLGDRMKRYEAQETARRLLPELPIYARIDGHGFSRFTRGMNRPYDDRMSWAMVSATRVLVERTHAPWATSNPMRSAWCGCHERVARHGLMARS